MEDYFRVRLGTDVVKSLMKRRIAFCILLASIMLCGLWLSVPVKASDTNQTQTPTTPPQFYNNGDSQSLLFMALVLITIIAAVTVILTVVISREKLG